MELTVLLTKYNFLINETIQGLIDNNELKLEFTSSIYLSESSERLLKNKLLEILRLMQEAGINIEKTAGTDNYRFLSDKIITTEKISQILDYSSQNSSNSLVIISTFFNPVGAADKNGLVHEINQAPIGISFNGYLFDTFNKTEDQVNNTSKNIEPSYYSSPNPEHAEAGKELGRLLNKHNLELRKSLREFINTEMKTDIDGYLTAESQGKFKSFFTSRFSLMQEDGMIFNQGVEIIKTMIPVDQADPQEDFYLDLFGGYKERISAKEVLNLPRTIETW
jgi:hypothetical protein